MPALSDLEYFLAILTAGSLTKASQKLRVQQSTLTIAIQRLERLTDSALLVRTRSGIQPTQAGRAFAERAKALLESWYGITASLEGEAASPQARISFGCHQSTGFYTLKRFLPDFLSENPKIEVSIRHDYTHQIVEDVLRCRLDFGLTVNPISHRELTVKPLYQTYLGLFGSAETARLNRDVLLYDPEMYGLEFILQKLKQRGTTFGRYIPISGLDTIASLVINGGGQALLPADTACSLGASPLTLLWEPREMPTFDVCVIYRSDVALSAGAQLFLAAILSQLGALKPGRKHRQQKRTSKPLMADINPLH